MGITPGLIGAAVNDGLVARNQSALVWWGLAVLGLGVVQALSALMGDRLAFVAKIGTGYTTRRC